jgi:hypothetical protein
MQGDIQIPIFLRLKIDSKLIAKGQIIGQSNKDCSIVIKFASLSSII